MALGTGYDQQACFLARSLEVLGERWTLLIVRDCFFGVRRFTDLRDHLSISRAVLSQRLQQLTEAGVLERDDTGGHAEYALTEAVASSGRWCSAWRGGASGTRPPPTRPAGSCTPTAAPTSTTTAAARTVRAPPTRPTSSPGPAARRRTAPTASLRAARAAPDAHAARA